MMKTFANNCKFMRTTGNGSAASARAAYSCADTAVVLSNSTVLLTVLFFVVVLLSRIISVRVILAVSALLICAIIVLLYADKGQKYESESFGVSALGRGLSPAG